MPNNDERRQFKRTRHELHTASDGERSYYSLRDWQAHNLACAIIEQAVYDWIDLDYGRLGYAVAKGVNNILYRAELLSFFKSSYFEYLLAFALPEVTPQAVREKLKIEEPPERTKRNARILN